MLTEFQKRKITVLFNHEDLDHDGILEEGDYEEFARRICDSLGFLPGSSEYSSIQAQIGASRRQDTFTEFLQRKGGRLSLDDYMEWMDIRISNNMVLTQFIPGYVAFVLKLWDRDADGKLSADEFVRLEWCYGVDEASAREAFRRLDRDSDGYLGMDEMIQDVKEFYYSQDPGAPGNWLFGPY